MLYALLEAGIRPDLVLGSSMGALNGAYLAGHPSPGEIHSLARLWESIHRSDVFPISVRRILGGLLGWRDHLFDPLGLRTLILRAGLGFGRLEEAPLPLHLVATDLTTGAPLVLSRGDTVDSVMASAALPGAFPPVELDGRWLVDGTMTAHALIGQAEHLGATTVYLLSAALPRGGAPPGAMDVVQRALAPAVNDGDSSVMAEVATRLQVNVVPPPPLPAQSVSDFHAASELIDASYLQTRTWLQDRTRLRNPSSR
jgi:NTE family protein